MDGLDPPLISGTDPARILFGAGESAYLAAFVGASRPCRASSLQLPMSVIPADPRTAVDFDLHGFLRIRLEGAGDPEVRLVERQVGPLRTTTHGTPDITIAFRDAVERAAPATLLGLDDAGFTETGFLVLRSKHKAAARLHIPMDRIGSDHLRIECERGLPAVPLLIAVINLTMLARGILPLHASAFTWRGTGVLATGWAKGGKTETLLAFADHGAQYVGDEWVYLTPDGHMLGIPEPIRVWDWQLAEVPRHRAHLSTGVRARLASLRALSGGLRRLASGQSRARGLARRTLPLVDKQRYVHLEPGRLFGNGTRPEHVRMDVMFWVASSEAPGIQVTPIDPTEVARRMVFSLQDEAADLLSWYNRFRFAFPDRVNPIIETAAAQQEELLLRALTGVRAYRVLHPYPVSIPGLFDAMSPYATP